MVILLVMIQEFYCTNTREYTNIPSCSGKLVFNSSLLKEGIFVYMLVNLYNKAQKGEWTFVRQLCVISKSMTCYLFKRTWMSKAWQNGKS